MSPRVSFVCAGCRSRLGASQKFAGRSCRCPRCGQPVKVPLPRRADRPVALVLDGGRTPRRADDCLPVVLRYRG